MASSEALRKAAEEGDAEAQYQLGLIYVYGNDEPKDAAKAFEWMSRAAAQNVVPAKRELGIMLVSGEGTEPDIPRGVQLLSEAADNLDPGTLYHLGLMYEKGIGVPLDLQKAVRMLAYAASMGFPGAEVDADRIDRILTEERNRNLRARPLLKLMVSDVDVEAACCKRMLDELLEQNIVFTETMQGPALLGEEWMRSSTAARSAEPSCSSSHTTTSGELIRWPRAWRWPQALPSPRPTSRARPHGARPVRPPRLLCRGAPGDISMRDAICACPP